MMEQTPQQPEENLPDWEGLKDGEIDPGIKRDILELTKINEEKFWSDKELARMLQGDPTFAQSLWLGLQMLLESHGLTKHSEVIRKFDELSDGFTGTKQAGPEEQINDIRELRKYFAALGFSEKEMSAKETLKRAYFGYADRKDTEALRMLQNAAKEDPAVRKAMEEFEREVRGRERGK